MFDDGIFEVVGFTGAFHMGRVHLNISKGIHLGQGRNLKIRNTRILPAQVDGEPWLLDPCETEISFLNQANMLFNLNSKVQENFNNLAHEVHDLRASSPNHKTVNHKKLKTSLSSDNLEILTLKSASASTAQNQLRNSSSSTTETEEKKKKKINEN